MLASQQMTFVTCLTARIWCSIGVSLGLTVHANLPFQSAPLAWLAAGHHYQGASTVSPSAHSHLCNHLLFRAGAEALLACRQIEAE